MAAPRTTAEPPTRASEKSGGGLSAQTLIVAAAASATAAIVVSRLWEQGTIIASAMTPVVVAIVSELIRKPIESDVVRRPVRAVGSGASRVSRVSRREEARPRSGRTPTVMAPPPPGVDEGLRQREEGVEPGPVKVYSSGSNRRPRDPDGGGGPRRPLKIAIVTGLIAFLIAAAALTLPELIFGGSVTGGKRDTTYFGGGKSSSDEGEKQDGASDGQTDEPAQDQAPSDSGDQAPSDSGGDEPAPDEQQAPEQQEPAPAPSQPAPAPAPTPPAPTP